MKLPDAKDSIGQRMGKGSRRCQHGNWTRWRERGGHSGSTRRGRQRKYTLLLWWTSYNQSTKLTKGRAPKWHRKRRLRISSGVYWTRFACVSNDTSECNGCHCRTTGLCWPAADAVSAYTQVKMEDVPKLLKNPKSECPYTWVRLPRHERPKSWANIADPMVLLERNLYGRRWAGLLWERQFEEVLLELGWEKLPNWACLSVHRKQGIFLSV